MQTCFFYVLTCNYTFSPISCSLVCSCFLEKQRDNFLGERGCPGGCTNRAVSGEWWVRLADNVNGAAAAGQRTAVHHLTVHKKYTWHEETINWTIDLDLGKNQDQGACEGCMHESPESEITEERYPTLHDAKAQRKGHSSTVRSAL
jgi:hypothetical protein